MSLEPTPEQLQAFAQAPDEGPVVMLNLLRYAERARGVDEDVSGREAYARYAAGVFAHLQRVGGEVVFSGEAAGSLIGPPGERWDTVVLVRYPSRAAFLEMVSDPGYQEVARWRTAALEDSRLVPVATTTGPDPRD